MFYPVFVFDGKGDLKKEISGENLSERHWSNFLENGSDVFRVLPKGLNECGECGAKFINGREGICLACAEVKAE